MIGLVAHIEEAVESPDGIHDPGLVPGAGLAVQPDEPLPGVPGPLRGALPLLSARGARAPRRRRLSSSGCGQGAPAAPTTRCGDDGAGGGG